MSDATTPDPSLAAYQAFLAEHRQEIIDSIVDDSIALLDFYRNRPRADSQAGMRLLANIVIDTLPLRSAEPLLETLEQRLLLRFGQGLELTQLLVLPQIFRKQFMRVSERAIASGVPHSYEGVQLVAELCHHVSTQMLGFYRERLELFQTLAENTLDGILIHDDAGTVHFANASAARLFGEESSGGLIGQQLFDLYAPEERQRLEQAIASGSNWSDQFWAHRAGGDRWLAHSSTVELSAMQRRLARHALILRDVTHDVETAGERARLVDDLKQQADELRMYQALVENTTDGVAIGTLDGAIAYANPAWRAMTGYGEEVIQMPYQALFPERELPRLIELGEHTLSGETWQGYLTYRRKDGSEFEALVSSFLLRNAAGEPLGQGAFVRDTTEMRRTEKEREQLQQEVIDAQQAAIRELSTPLIPLAAGVVAMPLVGTITSERAQQIMETLLEGISEQSADVALIDITGVKMVDTQVADALLRAAKAAKLLGAHIVLTGISADVAQTLVGLGAQLTGIETRGTLREGIAFALERELLEA